MNAVTASLCKKPVIGVAMWLLSFCITNQALHEKYVDLGKVGVLLSEQIEAPMNESYGLIFIFQKSTEFDEPLTWKSAICGTGTDVNSQAIFLVKITNTKNNSAQTHSYPVSCSRPAHEDSKQILLGNLQLEAGRYRFELSSETAVHSLAGKRVGVLLVGEGAGFP